MQVSAFPLEILTAEPDGRSGGNLGSHSRHMPAQGVAAPLPRSSKSSVRLWKVSILAATQPPANRAFGRIAGFVGKLKAGYDGAGLNAGAADHSRSVPAQVLTTWTGTPILIELLSVCNNLLL